MAAGLGFIEFATGDILTAAAANGYLASQTVMVFASSAARTAAIASPQEGMVSYLKDTDKVQYYSGSAWVSVGGGKVLQVVQASTTTATTVASTTPTDSTLTATITPSATTSKVMVIYNQSLYVERSTNTAGGSVRLLRGASTVQDLGPCAEITANGTTFLGLDSIPGATYLDSPATTSATTYKTQVNANSTLNGGLVIAQRNSRPSTITLIEIGA